MSEISENEIKSMTKEQNYMRGYEDGKSDILDKIRAEINVIDVCGRINKYDLFVRSADGVKQMALNIIDKYKAESEESNGRKNNDI